MATVRATSRRRASAPLERTVHLDPVPHALADRHRTDTPSRWYVLKTRIGAERTVARVLDHAGFEHYLPLVPRFREEAFGTTQTEEPLFDSMLFLRGDDDAVRFAWSTHRVATIHTIENQSRFDRQLRQIRAALDAGAVLALGTPIRDGRAMQVIDGPYEGIEGFVESTIDPEGLRLPLDDVRLTTVLDVEASQLAPLDSNAFRHPGEAA
ncbi:MAG: transcription termination/antitermination NusG family protein [Planctomycetota bacterium]